ncbi:MAG: hypothetical protein HXX09_02930 [Bacteroidetes bacterium]|nr:hypothetical protein [Bacteroidota bacterium]
MKRNYKLLSVLVILICISFSITAQTVTNASDTTKKENLLKKLSKKLSYEVKVGTSVFSDTKHFSASSLEIAPIVNLNLKRNFRLFAGTSFVSTQVFGNKTTNSENLSTTNNDKRFYSSILMVGGAYDVSKRLTISGSVFTQTQLFNLKSFDENFKNAAKGISLGLNYKVSEKSSIGIEIQFHDGSNFDTYRNLNSYPLNHLNSNIPSGFGNSGMFGW